VTKEALPPSPTTAIVTSMNENEQSPHLQRHSQASSKMRTFYLSNLKLILEVKNIIILEVKELRS